MREVVTYSFIIVGFNVETVDYKGTAFVTWDVAGGGRGMSVCFLLGFVIHFSLKSAIMLHISFVVAVVATQETLFPKHKCSHICGRQQ